MDENYSSLQVYGIEKLSIGMHATVAQALHKSFRNICVYVLVGFVLFGSIVSFEDVNLQICYLIGESIFSFHV